jgi:hypothetical protein
MTIQISAINKEKFVWRQSRLRRIMIVCLLSLQACSYELTDTYNSNKNDPWINPIPASLLTQYVTKEIPDSYFFQISASKLDTAEYWLADKSFIKEDSNTYEFFGQRNFTCPKATTPYLIRAIYYNGGTGSFSIKKVGASLLVEHDSLGKPGTILRSALVACIDFEPKNVYNSLSTAL